MPVPTSTYRLQLHAGFTFDDAAATAPYLSDLGVTHLYLSPILQSASGSTHGYDVTDPTRIDAARGGAPGFDRLAAVCRELGLGIIIDIVPNHMDVESGENPWWQDVLRHGRESQWADAFDIDWDAPGTDGRVVLPFLGKPLEAAIEAGELTVEGDAIAYFDSRFPLRPDCVPAATLTDLLREQHYELAYWREASGRVNYRRFFTINGLAAIRVEDPAIFEAVHAMTAELCRRDEVHGLRVDHPDGLRDPAAYFDRLRAGVVGDKWLIAEKILEPGEAMPDSWPVDGTTGYDFLNDALGVMLESDNEPAIQDGYREMTGDGDDFAAHALECKRHACLEQLRADLDRLTRHARAVVGTSLPPDKLREAIADIAAHLPVYRTYLRPGEPAMNARDAKLIQKAATASANSEVAERLATVLARPGDSREAQEFVLRFQSYCASAMAKGVEDTAFYRYQRLIALNEVGGDPGTFGITQPAFHERVRARTERHPTTMTTTATHDTKRGESVRARLAVLSETPDTWNALAKTWHGRAVDAGYGDVDPRDRHLLLQTLVGDWPLGTKRLTAFMLKAGREAKLHTSWTDQGVPYENRLEALAANALTDPSMSDPVDTFVASIRHAGRIKSLVQCVLRLAGPGVPDTYQGCELWDGSLVDPDNRRPVDYDQRRDILAGVRDMEPADLWPSLDEPDDPGRAKLWLVTTLLHLRRELPDVLGFRAPYQPIDLGEPGVLAFGRGAAPSFIAVLPVRSNRPAAAVHVTLPEGSWQNICDDRRVQECVTTGELWQTAPLALLLRKGTFA